MPLTVFDSTMLIDCCTKPVLEGTRIVAPFSCAFRIHLKAIGWFSATLLPSTRIVLQCCRSTQ